MEHIYRLAASGWIPKRIILGKTPGISNLPARSGHLSIEIVTHCWNYADFLKFQLSSLVLYPPTKLSVRMTVFHSPEDPRTVELLEFFGRQQVPNVIWNWVALDKHFLFRRAIGRNRAALATEADWVWFTDCDVVFHEGCLDHLADQLQGRDEVLLYPRVVGCSQLQDENHNFLRAVAGAPTIVDIDPANFVPITLRRAVGYLQITHGDAARKLGYCNSIPYYQRPVVRWQKTYEDRVFRWLLGSQGRPIDVPALYRIEHARKGRDDGNWKNPVLRWTSHLLRRQRRWLAER